MHYIVAIDQGTSSTRAMLFTVDGSLICSSQYPISQYYPHPGWVEQDPEEIWSKTVKAVQEVCATVDNKDILACGISNQRETTLVWDKRDGKCIGPAIVWQDRRTDALCQSMAKDKKLIQEKTGLILDPYFSATKLHWILQHHAQANTLASSGNLAFGTIDSFLIWRLSAGKAHRTDVTNASRTMLFDIHNESWDQALLDVFNIPVSILPQVCASDAHFALMDKSILGREIPITGVAGDQQAALIGQSCFEKGMIKATFGTGGFLLMNTGEKAIDDSNHLLATIAYKIGGKTAYGLEGSIYHAGTTIKWLRDEMALIKSAEESEDLAASLSSNEGVYLISSFTGLGAPHWISSPGSAIVGISQSSRRAHFVRAALEGVCYQVRDVMDCMTVDSGIVPDVLRVDGGMAANNWMLQFLSNQCNLTVQRPVNIETTAYGACVLAALGIGYYENTDQLQQKWQCQREYKRNESLEVSDKNYTGWRQALAMVIAGHENSSD